MRGIGGLLFPERGMKKQKTQEKAVMAAWAVQETLMNMVQICCRRTSKTREERGVRRRIRVGVH